MFCHKCGNQALEDAGFCQKCGAKLIVEQAAPPIPSEPVPAVPPEPVKPTPPQAPVAPIETVVPEPKPAAPPTLVADPVTAVEPKPIAPTLPPQAPVTPAPTITPAPAAVPNQNAINNKNAYERLKSSGNYPQIKVKSLDAKGVILEGKYNKYIVNDFGGHVRVKTRLRLPLAIYCGLLWILRLIIRSKSETEKGIALIHIENTLGKTVIDDKSAAILGLMVVGIVVSAIGLLGILIALIEADALELLAPASILLIGGIALLFGSIIHKKNTAKKEATQLMQAKEPSVSDEYRMSALPSELPENAPALPEPKKKLSKKLLFGIIGVAVVAIVAIIIVIFLSLGGDTDDYDYDPSPSSSFDYSKTLTETYTNEEEGFSFKYPGGWDFEDDDDSIVSINTAGLSFAANIGVTKGEADDEFFSATKGDFLDFYSEEFDELNIVSLSDVYLDGIPARKLAMTYTYEGVSFVGVQHFYKIGSDMYIVSYLSLQSNFDEYEPIFDAIMNSYRITCTENKTGSGPSNHDDAYNIAQAWLDAHPAFDMAISGGDNDLYQADGEEYYRFYLDYRHDILVHSKTGALFIRETDDGEYPSPPVITPLDDYYNRYYGANTPNGNKYPGEITYKGILVSSFLGVSKDSVIELLGTPSSENSTFYVFDYDGISFQCNTNWDITHVYPKPARCEVDGITLNKNRAGLIELLGNPDSEGPGEYDEDYGMTYYMPYYFIHITLPSPDEVATGIYMSQR